MNLKWWVVLYYKFYQNLSKTQKIICPLASQPCNDPN